MSGLLAGEQHVSRTVLSSVEISNFANFKAVLHGQYIFGSKLCDVLGFATVAYLNGGPVKVLDVLNQKFLGSSATNHRAIHKLIKKKFLVPNSDTIDERLKHLISASLTIKMVSKLGERRLPSTNMQISVARALLKLKIYKL